MSTLLAKLRRTWTRAGRDEDGAVLVEFAVTFPIMLLFFAVIIEATRLLWSYQIVIEGVRDASRYAARVGPVDTCITGAPLAVSNADLFDIVASDSQGSAIFPPLVTVNQVVGRRDCIDGNYRTDPAPVATVTARITIDFPLGSIFRLFGDELGSVTTEVADSARIYGQ